MSHEFVICGQMCYCDGEDHGQPAPADCIHDCGPEYEEGEFDDDWDEDE